MAMHAARLVPDAFRHVAGLRLGRQGFHMGFNLGEGFLGLFELVGMRDHPYAKVFQKGDYNAALLLFK